MAKEELRLVYCVIDSELTKHKPLTLTPTYTQPLD